MRMKLLQRQMLPGDIWQFDFQPERPLDHIAGQFIECTIKHDNPDNRGQQRWFTISSSPTEPIVSITVRFYEGSSSYKQALRALLPGDEIQASEPLGDFVLPLDVQRPLVWIAGGIGVTPFRSMAKWLTDTSERRDIHMVHIIQNHDDHLYQDVFDAASIPVRDLHDTSTKGRPSTATLLNNILDAQDRLYYISGPEDMVRAIANDLINHAIDRNNVITDMFLGY